MVDAKEPGTISRRDLLRKGRNLLAIGVISTAVTSSFPDIRSDSIGSLAVPEPISSNLMGPKELKRNNITIYSTPQVKLYLGRELVSRFPAMKDAKEGKNNGVVVSLMNSTHINWPSFDQLPEDSLLAYQAFNLSPSEYPDSYWKRVEDFWLDQNRFSNSLITFLQDIRDKNIDTIIQKLVDRGVRPLPGKPEDLDRDIEGFRKMIKDADSKIQLVNDRQKAIDYVMEYGVPPVAGVSPPIGLAAFIRTEDVDKSLALNGLPPGQRARLETLRSHPEYLDKFYVYLPVGGDMEPDPKYSFVSQDDLKNYKEFSRPGDEGRFIRNKPDPEIWYREARGLRGFDIRHEMSHYDPYKSASTERAADQAALDSIISAWKRYQGNGDPREYGFVFVTKKGVTITENLQDQTRLV